MISRSIRGRRMNAASCRRAVCLLAYAGLIAERNRLAVQYRFVPAYVAKRLRDHESVRILGLDDAVGLGQLVLIRAVERFDPSRGVNIKTYLYWAIRRELVRRSLSGGLIHVPEYRFEPNHRANQGRDRTDVERAMSCQTVPRFGTRGDGDGDVRYEPAARSEPCPLEVAEDDSCLQAALRKLLPRWRQVIRWRFGIGDVGPLKLHEIGERLGVSKQAVQFIEGKALARLRVILDTA